MTATASVSPTRSLVQAERKTYGRSPDVQELPDLIRVQLDSYNWFVHEGLKDLFEEILPIQDFTGTRMELHFGGYSLGEPKYPEAECRNRDMTYAAPLRVSVRLVVKESGEVKEQELFMGDFPLMTKYGTFIINGAERVVVSQLVRSPGVYFSTLVDTATGRSLCSAKLIPNRGAWLELETSSRDVLTVKVDRKRKIPITTLLRALDVDQPSVDEAELGTDDRMRALLGDVDTDPQHTYLDHTIAKESVPTEAPNGTGPGRGWKSTGGSGPVTPRPQRTPAASWRASS